jgi:hypothetical protein
VNASSADGEGRFAENKPFIAVVVAPTLYLEGYSIEEVEQGRNQVRKRSIMQSMETNKAGTAVAATDER